MLYLLNPFFHIFVLDERKLLAEGIPKEVLEKKEVVLVRFSYKYIINDSCATSKVKRRIPEWAGFFKFLTTKGGDKNDKAREAKTSGPFLLAM